MCWGYSLITQGNASVYICGNAQTMAADVDAALLQMLEHEGHMTAEEALAFKSAMKDNGRLHREIYM